MRRIVLIDGENLTYALRKYDSRSGGSGSRDFLSLFDYRGMLEEIFEDTPIDEIIWYGAKIKVSKENRKHFADKVDNYVKIQSRMVNHLGRQNIRFEKVGYLRDRTVDIGGETVFKLVEKGVDVGIAVKIMELSAQDSECEIILVSSDTDLLPAIDSAKKNGTKFIFLGYDYMPIHSIQKRAEYSRMVTPVLFKKYKKDKK